MFLFCLHSVGLTGGETWGFQLAKGLLRMPTVTRGPVMLLVRVYVCVCVCECVFMYVCVGAGGVLKCKCSKAQ